MCTERGVYCHLRLSLCTGKICWANATDAPLLLLVLRCCVLYLWSHLLTAVLIELYFCGELRCCLHSHGKSLHVSTRVLYNFNQKEWILTFLVHGSSVSSRHISTTIYMGFNVRVTAIRSSRSMYHDRMDGSNLSEGVLQLFIILLPSLNSTRHHASPRASVNFRNFPLTKVCSVSFLGNRSLCFSLHVIGFLKLSLWWTRSCLGN